MLNKVWTNKLITKHQEHIRSLLKATNIKDFTKVLDYNNWINLESILENERMFLEKVNLKTKSEIHIDSEKTYVDEIFTHMKWLNKYIEFIKKNPRYTSKQLETYLEIKCVTQLVSMKEHCLVSIKNQTEWTQVNGIWEWYNINTEISPLIVLN